MHNPAALYLEGFRSVADLTRHMDALSDEQKLVLSLFDEIERSPPISRKEAEQFRDLIEKTISDLFEGADEVFEVSLCGGYRLGEKEFKDIDILITRNNDDGPTRHVMLKVIEKLEEEGVIVQ